MNFRRVLPEPLYRVLVSLPGFAVDNADLQPFTLQVVLNGILGLAPGREDHQSPAVLVLLLQRGNQSAEPLQFGAPWHRSDDALDGGRDFGRGRAVARHVGQLRGERVWAADQRLEDADLRQPVHRLDWFGDHSDKAKLSI